MKRATALLSLMVVLLAPSAVRSELLIDAQAGVASSYDYPLSHASGRAVLTDGANLVASIHASMPVAPRWSLLLGGMYWSDAGGVTLPKIPESPNWEVSSRVVPAVLGLRLRPGPLDQSVALHLEIGAGAAILRTKVREVPPAFFGELSPERSSMEVAPTGYVGAALSTPVLHRADLVFRGAYLFSGDFGNDEALIADLEYGGLREMTMSAGVQVRLGR